jgi:hypothetical protein
MDRSRRRARRLVLAGLVPAVVLTLGISTWSAAGSGFGPFPGPTTQVVDRSDRRFDVLVQRRPERLGSAGERLIPPDGRPRLTAARAFAIAGVERQPHGAKPSVRLATFTDPDFPTPVGPGHRLVPRPLRVLVWVVVVPDVPVVEFGPGGGPEFGPDFKPDAGPGPGPGGRTAACPTRTPVDALTGKPLGTWQEC